MSSHGTSIAKLWRFGRRVLDLNCTLLLACVLLSTTTLRGRSAFSTTAGDSSKVATQNPERRQTTQLVLGCEVGVFCSPVEGLDFDLTTKDEKEARDVRSCQPRTQLEASSTAEQLVVYTAEKSGPEQSENRRHRLRATSSPQPHATRPSLLSSSSPSIQPCGEKVVRTCCSPHSAQKVGQSSSAAERRGVPHYDDAQQEEVVPPSRVFGEKAERLATLRSLVAEDATTASIMAPGQLLRGGTERDESSEPLPAVWTSVQDTEEETSFTDLLESHAALSLIQSQGDETTMEATKDDDIVSSQRFGCRHDSCARIPMTVPTPSAIPVAPLYPISMFAPQALPFASVPLTAYPTAPYSAWPMTHSPFAYYGSFANQNNWFTAAQASTVQTGIYGGGVNGWTGMGYPILY